MQGEGNHRIKKRPEKYGVAQLCSEPQNQASGGRNSAERKQNRGDEEPNIGDGGGADSRGEGSGRVQRSDERGQIKAY